MAHCHGKVMGAGWHMLLRTLQHLTWILGLVPTDNGQLVPSPSADGANVVRNDFKCFRTQGTLCRNNSYTEN